MKIPVIFVLSSILLIGNFSCRKDEPTPVTAAPVFYFRGTIGSTAYNLQAGVNNYYMYSSFNQDQNNVYSFGGFLNVYNCTSCGNSPQFKISDFQATAPNGNAAIETSLTPGYYSFLIGNGSPTAYSVTFYSINQGTPSGYFWDFGDGTTLNSQPPNSSATHTYSRPGIYHVKHVASFTTHADTTVYNVRFGIPEAELLGSFSPNAVGETLTFYNSVSGVSPYTYYWDFGDGITSTQATPIHTYANPGVYNVYMRVTDAIGGVIECVRNAATQFYTPAYGEGFYFNPPVGNANAYGFSNATIEWRDASGETYTSNDIAQPSTSYFKLISVEDYLNNSNGVRTKKIHLNFRCKLYSTSTSNSLQINDGDAVIAVGYQ